MTDEPITTAGQGNVHVDSVNKALVHPRRVSRIRIAERRAQALELRRSGMDYREIAARLGVSTTLAWRDVQAAVKDIIREPAEDVRTLEIERLDRLFEAHYARALNGDHRSTELCLKVMDRRGRMLGIDLPHLVDFTPWVVEYALAHGVDPKWALEAARNVVKHMGY